MGNRNLKIYQKKKSKKEFKKTSLVFGAEIEKIKSEHVNVNYSTEFRGPGRAGKYGLQLNQDFIFGDKPNFTESRLIIVLLHEYGHVLDGRTRQKRKGPASFDQKVESEYNAFKYSVEQAILRAKDNNKSPLEEVVKNLKLRSKSENKKDPHIPAIRKLLSEPIWQEAEELLRT